MADFDLAVIGAGPGGYAAAILAAKSKMKVALIEKTGVGGTCLQVGCIPSKILLDAAKWLEHGKSFAEALNGGLPNFDYAKLISLERERVAAITKSLEWLVTKAGDKEAKVKIIKGEAKFLDSKTLEINGTDKLTAKRILIACGAMAKIFPGIPYPHERIWTNVEALKSKEPPTELIILGGGAIGCEFASFFSGLNIPVTIVELMWKLLPLEDADVSKEIERLFKKRGVKVVLSKKAEIEVYARGVRVKLTDGSVINGSHVLVATGIAPATENLELKNAGIVLNERGFIKVGLPDYQTNAQGIYAIGDAISADGRPPLALAHVAAAEAEKVVTHIAGITVEPIDYDNIPTCVFTIPEVANVGLTEEKARKMKCGNPNHEIFAKKIPYISLGRATALNQRDGFVKIVEHRDTFGKTKLRQIAGAQIIGEHASEIIHVFAAARHAEDSIDHLKNLIFQHPTYSELIAEVLRALDGEAVHAL